MNNFIEALTNSSQEIICQLLNKELLTKNICIETELKLKDNISVISSVVSPKNSLQIAINYSKDLVRRISSIVHGDIPIVTIDVESKHIILEISKLLTANALIYLEDYDESFILSSPFILESSDMSYSTTGLIASLEFILLGEILNISIFPIDKREDIINIKTLKKTISS